MIDFVVTWVDGNDTQWKNERDKYSIEKIKNSDSQYREWDIFKYWFRSIEKYAPWVNNVFLVTYGHIPEWLNINHKKLKIVKHTDFIDEEFLPTFSSHTIELNLHKIAELSETFVYFNDDIYLGAPVSEKDFFVNGKPCYSPIMSVLTPFIPGDPFVHYLCNNLSVINKNFNKKEVLKKNLLKWYNYRYGKLLLKNVFYGFIGKFTGFTNYHNASSMLKSVYTEVWGKEEKLLSNTCMNKFRGLNDVNQYVMSYYYICKGDFHPRSPKSSKMLTIGNDNQILEAFESQKYKMICVNDNPNDINFELEYDNIHKIMEKIFPQKSEYEL